MLSLLAASAFALSIDPLIDLPDEGPNVVHPAVTEIVMDGASVEVGIKGPDFVSIGETRREGFTSLISVRESFNSEINASTSRM